MKENLEANSQEFAVSTDVALRQLARRRRLANTCDLNPLGQVLLARAIFERYVDLRSRGEGEKALAAIQRSSKGLPCLFEKPIFVPGVEFPQRPSRQDEVEDQQLKTSRLIEFVEKLGEAMTFAGGFIRPEVNFTHKVFVGEKLKS